jgi:hypothetical protein
MLAIASPVWASVPVGVIEGSGGKTYLYPDQGPVCVGRTFKAEFVPKHGVPIGGCWMPVNGGVSLVFFDGDSGVAPSESIKKPEAL